MTAPTAASMRREPCAFSLWIREPRNAGVSWEATLVRGSLLHPSSRRAALPHEIPDSVLDCCPCDVEILGEFSPTDTGGACFEHGLVGLRA